MIFEIYTYGNGEILTSVFNAIAMCLSNLAPDKCHDFSEKDRKEDAKVLSKLDFQEPSL